MRRFRSFGHVTIVCLLFATTLVVGLGVGLVPLGQRQAQPAKGKYQLVDTPLAGPSAPKRPPAGGAPGAKGALAVAPSTPAAPDTGWSTRVEVPDHPLMVGLSWQGDTAGTVEIRSGDGTTFGDWVSLDSTPVNQGASAPDRGPAMRSTDAVWVGPGVSEIEVQVTKGPLPGLKLTAFNWQGSMPTAGSTGVGAEGASAEPAQPWIHPRSDWDNGQGYRTDYAGCESGPIAAPELKMAIVHHTDNANNYSPSQVPMLINGIYQWHTINNHWCDIGYNFLIDQYGGVWQGRSGDIALPIWGSHAIGFNYANMGIALIGTYQPGGSPSGTQPSAAALNSLENVIAWKFGIHGVNPLGTTQYTAGAGSYWPDGTVVTMPTIVGHRDTSSTDCPGDSLEVQIPTIRQQVANRIAFSAFPTSRWAPFTSAHALVAQQFTDILYRQSTNTDQAAWTNVMVAGFPGWVVPASIIGSWENQATTLPVLRLYFAVFGRWADYGGLAGWATLMKQGVSLQTVADSFAASPEFKLRYGTNTTNKQFIDLLYQNVLGRGPDPVGEAGWISYLNNGMTRGQVVLGFSESTENVFRQSNNTNIGQAYEPMLHRQPDPGSYLAAVNIFNHGGLNAVVQMIFNSPEYASRVPH